MDFNPSQFTPHSPYSAKEMRSVTESENEASSLPNSPEKVSHIQEVAFEALKSSEWTFEEILASGFEDLPSENADEFLEESNIVDRADIAVNEEAKSSFDSLNVSFDIEVEKREQKEFEAILTQTLEQYPEHVEALEQVVEHESIEDIQNQMFDWIFDHEANEFDATDVVQEQISRYVNGLTPQAQSEVFNALLVNKKFKDLLKGNNFSRFSIDYNGDIDKNIEVSQYRALHCLVYACHFFIGHPALISQAYKNKQEGVKSLLLFIWNTELGKVGMPVLLQLLKVNQENWSKLAKADYYRVILSQKKELNQELALEFGQFVKDFYALHAHKDVIAIHPLTKDIAHLLVGPEFKWMDINSFLNKWLESAVEFAYAVPLLAAKKGYDYIRFEPSDNELIAWLKGTYLSNPTPIQNFLKDFYTPFKQGLTQLFNQLDWKKVTEKNKLRPLAKFYLACSIFEAQALTHPPTDLVAHLGAKFKLITNNDFKNYIASVFATLKTKFELGNASFVTTSVRPGQVLPRPSSKAKITAKKGSNVVYQPVTGDQNSITNTVVGNNSVVGNNNNVVYGGNLNLSVLNYNPVSYITVNILPPPSATGKRPAEGPPEGERETKRPKVVWLNPPPK